MGWQGIKAEAQRLLDQGPEPLSEAEINHYRYAITCRLDDFLGSESFEDCLFVAHDLALRASDLILTYHRQWILGRGKWVMRGLRRFDPTLARQLTSALASFYRTGDKSEMI